MAKTGIQDRTDHDREPLSGLVERVTFHSPETGFCVLQVKVRGSRELVTVIGSAASIQPGEFIQCSGRWDNHRDHGMQFKTRFLKVMPPNSIDGIEKLSRFISGTLAGTSLADIVFIVALARVIDVVELRLAQLDARILPNARRFPNARQFVFGWLAGWVGVARSLGPAFGSVLGPTPWPNPLAQPPGPAHGPLPWPSPVAEPLGPAPGPGRWPKPWPSPLAQSLAQPLGSAP